MTRKGLFTLAVTLLAAMTMTASPLWQSQHSVRFAGPSPKRRLKSETLKFLVTAPKTKPDGKPFDAPEDFDRAVLLKIPPSERARFIEQEAGPDIIVVIVRLDDDVLMRFEGQPNKFDLSFQMERPAKAFGIIVLDSDGDGQLFTGRYHDLIGTVILAPDGLSAEQQEELSNKLRMTMRSIGIQSVEYPGQRRTDSQIPLGIRVYNLDDCARTGCRPDGDDGLNILLLPRDN